jgi:Protein kinase domain
MDERGLTASGATATRHRLLMELGRGGTSVVQLAFPPGTGSTGPLCVLKTLRPERAADPEVRRVFVQEARLSSRVAHPNVARISEVREQAAPPALVMEYLEGQPLAAIADGAAVALPLPLLLHVLRGALAGVHAVAERGSAAGAPAELVHGGLSPRGIFVLYDGGVKVTDFGSAGRGPAQLRYMSPEQAAGGPADGRADVFAAGVILAEALTGRRYWADRSDDEIRRALLAQELPPPPDDGVAPPALTAVCARALAADPAARYATADEMRAALASPAVHAGWSAGPAEVGAFLRHRFAAARDAARRMVDSRVRAARQVALEASEHTTRVVSASALSAALAASAGRAPLRRRWPAGLALAAAAAAIVVGVLASGAFRVPAALADREPPAETPRACGPGLKACDGQCLSEDRPDHGCASGSCQPCGVSNATARCNDRHLCDVGTCYQDYGDCDGDSRNGCETNVRIDPDHCGGCGRKCPPLPHAQRGCGDTCTIWRCESGYRDCNAAVGDGCEAAVMVDPANCGQCGRACRRGQKCRRGECS